MGNLLGRIVSPNSVLGVMFPPSTTYDPIKDVVDLTGKVMIVTGGNTGIGYQTVKQLLLKNAKVYLAARSVAKAEDAAKRLEEETGKRPVFLKLDLANLESVRVAAEEFLSKENRLDVLFNNAGIGLTPNDMLTAQGYDIQFGTNVLGHYYFTKLLLPALERSTAHNGTKARIVNTSSSVSGLAPGATGIDWTTLKGGPARDDTLKRWGMRGKYKLAGTSKLSIILVSNLLVRRHGDIVTSCSLNPGAIRSDFQRHMPPLQKWIIQLFLYSAEKGAWTQLWAGTSPEGEGFSGKFLVPWARIGKADPRAANERTQDELEEWLEEQIQAIRE